MALVRCGIAESIRLLSLSGALLCCQAALGQHTPGTSKAEQRIDQLEATMPIGPRSARSLGMRVAWRLPIDAGDCRGVFISENVAFIVTSNNEIAAYELGTGQLRWRGFGGNPTDEIIDIVSIPHKERVLVIRTNAILTLSSLTGIPIMNSASQSSVQRFDWLASTPGALAGDKYIYGGLGGEVVWQNWNVGFPAHAHRIGRMVLFGPIDVPNYRGAPGITVAGARDGTIAAFNSHTSGGLWRTRLLGSPVGLPVAYGGYVYIASADQHLRSLDIGDGSVVWSHLFDRPLREGPTIVGNHVYQPVPGEGLVKLEARPDNPLDGIITWTADGVEGRVMGTVGDLLLIWDEHTGTLSTMSDATGAKDASVTARELRHAAFDGTTIVLVGGNDLECLVPAGSH